MAPYWQLRNVITSAFGAFGYTPSETEIEQLIPIVNTRSGGAERGRAAVANYVQTVRNQQERKKNDPLNQVIADERGFFTDSERQAQEYQDKSQAEQKRLESTIREAPQLFGSLTPEQIDQYLKPTSRAAEESSARLEGAAARRGIAGSSTELQTLADNERKYREDVLSQALQLGIQLKEAQVNTIQSNVNNLKGVGDQFRGFLPGSLQRQGAIADTQSKMAFDEVNYLNELPIYLRGISAQENAIAEAIQAREDAAKDAKKKGLFSSIGSVVGAGGGFLAGGPVGAVIGSQIGGQFGGMAAGGGGSEGGLDLSSLLLLTQNKPKSNFVGGGSYRAPTGDNYLSANV